MTDRRKTRSIILDLLKQDGAKSAGALAKAVGLSAMAVRLHLYDLRDQGLIESSSAPHSVGRPVKIWRLTREADTYFPNGHADLVQDLIGGMRAEFGESGIERVVAVRAEKQVVAYRKAMDRAQDVRRRLAILSEIRTREGYMAAVETVEGGWLLVENHCPICAAAESCSGLCRSELAVFRQALGPDVTVERTDHILAGARRCAYRVTPCAHDSASTRDATT